MEPSSNQNNVVSKNAPFIGPEKSLPEVTFKAIFFSVFLIIILSAANAYLGLKVGTTIAASIPAVVLAMGFLRLFKNHNVLEINVIQTTSSVAEGITAGIIFTIPALLIIHFWTTFNYWQTVGICITGGILGVFFSIPLRRALLEDKTLRFPEGTAIGQVMKASVDESTQLRPLVLGGLGGAVVGLFQTGFQVLANGYEYWVIKGKAIFGLGLGFSPAVIAAGYICGVEVGISTLIGIILGWLIGVPLLSLHYGIPVAGDAIASANQLWSDYIRYIGVGTMLVGGLWTLVVLSKPMAKGVLASLESFHEIKLGRGGNILRTEKDIPINFVIWGVLIILAVMFLQFFGMIHPAVINISKTLHVVISGIDIIYVLIGGFLFASISGYFAGLVGATNSPASGLLVSAELMLALILLAILEPHINFKIHVHEATYAAALVVLVNAFIGSAVVMTNESVQVLKAGQIIGATPWKQQLVLIGGVFVAALILPFILDLLFNAYGIGGVFPHPGMSHAQMLAAPQAGLMAAVAQGVFNHNMPWTMVIIGGVIAVFAIILDKITKFFYGLTLPVLGVGLGIYLPLDASVPIVIGGILAWVVQRKIRLRHRKLPRESHPTVRKSMQEGIMLACGIVAGAALVGVVLAVPFAIKQSADALRIMPANLSDLSGFLSIVVTLLLCYWIYRVSCKAK